MFRFVLGSLNCLLLLVASSIGAEPAVTFKDQTDGLGLKISNSAACWADFNNDGWVDLCAGGVWTNNAGRGFRKTADIPGSCVAADFDNDGFVDLFSWSALRLFRNNRGEGFTEVKLPKLPPCVSRGACWGDFNRDGFVDLYIGGYEDWGKGITYPFLILINERGKSFRLDRSETRYRARGVTACDFDRDGDLDVYVSNYRLQPNVLWVNDGKGRFKDQAAHHNVVATSRPFAGGHSIGAVWGDFNNDGLFDLFAGNFAHRDARGNQPQSRFLQNLGPKHGYQFKDLGTGGVHYQESYASPSAGDYDNDGHLDLFFTTVYGTASFGRKNHPVLFRGNGRFGVKDDTKVAGLSGLPPTYQAAWADFDNDGDLDLVSAGRLFVNQGTGNNWIRIALHGDGSRVNRSAVGAQVRILLGEQILTRQVEAGTGEGNQNDPTLHFGLGQRRKPVSVQIDWPNRTRQTITGVAVNRRHDIAILIAR
jgi:hypothetical protein